MSISYAHLLPMRRVNHRIGPDSEFTLDMDDASERAKYLASLKEQFRQHRPSIVLSHTESPDGRSYGRVLDVREFSDDEAASRGWLGGGFFLEVEWEDWVYEDIKANRFRFVSGKFVKNYQSAVEERVWPLFLSHVTLTPEPVFDLGQTELSAMLSKGAQPRVCSGESKSVLWSAALSKEAYEAATQPPAEPAEADEGMMEELIEKLTAAIEGLPAAVADAVAERMAPGGSEEEGAEAEKDEAEGAEAAKDEDEMSASGEGAGAPAPAPAAGADGAVMSKIAALESANRAMAKELRETTSQLRRRDVEAKVEALFSKHEIEEARRPKIIEQALKHGDEVLTLLEALPLRQEGKFSKRQSFAAGDPPATGSAAVEDFWAEVSKRHKEEHARDHVALFSKDRKPPRTMAQIAEAYAKEIGRPVTDFE